MTFQRALATATVLAALACEPTALQPTSDLSDVEVQLSLAAVTLAADDTASLIIRVENAGSRSIIFRKQSRCHLVIRVVDVVTRLDVLAGQGGWQCGADLGDVAIPAEGGHEREVLLHGVSPMPGHLHGLHLPAGEYEVIAQLSVGTQQVSSTPLRFIAR